MKLAFVIRPSRVWISSISASPRPCAVPPSIWPSTGCGLIALPTSCAAPIQTTRVSPSSTSTSATTRIAQTAKRDVGALAGDLAGLGVERRRRRVAVDALDVDLAAAARARARRAPRGRRRGRRRRPSTSAATPRSSRPSPTRRGRVRREPDVVDAELRARDLEDHVRDALPDLGGGAVDLGRAVVEQAHARGAVVVEALGEADVLEADREADAAPDALAARRVAGAARAAGAGRAAAPRPRAARARRRARITSATGSEPVICWPVGSVSPGASAFSSRSSTGSMPSSAASLSICASRGEARLHGAEAAHRAARRVVRVDRPSTRAARSARAYGPARERGRVRADGGRARGVRAAVEQDPHADVDELAVARRAVLAPDARRVPVHVAGERLLAVVDDLHRAVRVQREQRAVDLHRQVLAPAERAADAGEVDAHLLERQPEARRDLRAVDVQPLGRDVDVDAALAVGHREARLGAEERLVLDADLVDAADRDVARGVGVAVADHDVRTTFGRASSR